MRLRGRERGDDCRRVFGRDQHLAHSADDLQTSCFTIADRDRVEPVLWVELITDRARSQRHPGYAPARIARGKRGLEDHRLMRAMERADPQMDDTGPDRGAIVARPGDILGQSVQRRLRQPLLLRRHRR